MISDKFFWKYEGGGGGGGGGGGLVKLTPLKKSSLIKANKDYYEDSSKRCILEVDVKYPKRLHNFHCDFSFLPERMKINNRNNFVCNLYYKNNYVVHIRALKRASDHGIILNKVHKVIQFNQEAWLKEYIDMNILN